MTYCLQRTSPTRLSSYDYQPDSGSDKRQLLILELDRNNGGWILTQEWTTLALCCAFAAGPGPTPVADRLIPLVLLCSATHKQASLPCREADRFLIHGPRSIHTGSIPRLSTKLDHIATGHLSRLRRVCVLWEKTIRMCVRILHC